MREKVYSLILVFCLAIVLAGLAYTQIWMSERYREMSEGNRLKVVALVAPRGTIYDSTGEDMVKDVLSFNVAVIYSRIEKMDSLVDALSSILGVPKEEVASKIKKSRAQPYTPYNIVSDVGIEKAIHIEEISGDHPSLFLEVTSKREYLQGETAANVLGYIGLINRPEFERLRPYGFRMNDSIGRSGIEKEYDNYLRGRHGGKQVEVDHRGREVMVMGLKEPVTGKPVQLTINLELQKFCDGLLKDKRGSIIAMNPSTGAVVAMASAPSYDPNIFVDRKRNDEALKVLEDEEYPLLNRAISGSYPPGSVFKVVVATASLEGGTTTPSTLFSCMGKFILGGRAFHCWKEHGHGEQVLIDAIKNSCNVYFWRMGLLVGVDNIADYAGRFGIGSKTGIDLPGEASGILPSASWKKKNLKERWYRGETLNYAVGQGYMLCTPLQIARMISVFANRGFLVRPYIVEKIGDLPLAPSEKIKLDISRSNLDVVRRGMRAVVNDRRGTGMKARQKSFIVSGKTGTAQTSKGKSHGWFGGFAPFDDARLTVVVFDEYGGKGGYYAAETAGKVFNKAKELGLI